MDPYEDHLPEDLRDIAERLVEARASFSPLELDELHVRIGRRGHRAPRPSGIGARLRRNSIAGLAAAGLMLTSGAGAVIASTSLGSSGDGNSFSNSFDNTFGETGFHDTKDASDCEYWGPFSKTYVLDHGTVDVTFVQDCDDPNVYVHCDGGFDWKFGDGPNHYATDSWTGTVPTGTSGMTLSVHGSTYTLPVSG